MYKNVELKEKCNKCGTSLLIKTIVVNQWISGTCMNVGCHHEDHVYCPKCDREPQNRIEHV